MSTESRSPRISNKSPSTNPAAPRSANKRKGKEAINPEDSMAPHPEDRPRDPSQHPLARDPSKGMSPTNLATGMYGSRGERIRHVVHEGALRLPLDALQIILHADDSHLSTVQVFELPGLDSVVRPSVDKELESITLTEVYGMTVPEHAATQTPSTFRTIARNRRVMVAPIVAAETAVPVDAPERIRGGGEGDNPGNHYGASHGDGQQAQDVEPAQRSETTPAPTASSGMVPTVDSSYSQQQQQSQPHVASSFSTSYQTAAPLSVSSFDPPPSSTPASAPSSSTVHASAPSGMQQQVQAATPARIPSSSQPNSVSASVQLTSVGSATQGGGVSIASLPSVPSPPAVSSGTTSAVSLAPSTAVTVSVTTPLPTEPQVIALKKRPAPQWEQHIPGPSDEMQVDPANETPKPDWYSAKGVSELEKTLLYEWFDDSAAHRTPKSYLFARESILEMADKLGNRYITATMVRRAIPGDVCSLMRLHAFLTSYSLINEDAQNDSAPTPLSLQEDKAKSVWSAEMKDDLLVAVIEQSRKRPKLESPADAAAGLTIDWHDIAERVSRGMTSKDCERQFLAMPIQEDPSTERSITPDTSASDHQQQPAGDTKAEHSSRSVTQQEVLQEIVDSCDPDTARAITEAALRLSGGSLERAQKAGIVGIIASQAVEEARSHEDAIAHLLSDVVDLRMRKLENRLTLLDDIEGMLEAERVALELERRDLYTARCRHWFGGP